MGGTVIPEDIAGNRLDDPELVPTPAGRHRAEDRVKQTLKSSDGTELTYTIPTPTSTLRYNQVSSETFPKSQSRTRPPLVGATADDDNTARAADGPKATESDDGWSWRQFTVAVLSLVTFLTMIGIQFGDTIVQFGVRLVGG